MAYNLFIAYDLVKPGQNYRAVIHQIESLGMSYKFQYSFYYVHTDFDPNVAFHHVGAVMDANDRLAVINAHSGVVSNWDHPPVNAINAIWDMPRARPIMWSPPTNVPNILPAA